MTEREPRVVAHSSASARVASMGYAIPGAVIAVGAIGTLVAVLRLQGLWIPGVPGA